MIAVRRAAERYATADDRIESRHCFSAGRHYDPDNTAFGPLIAVDEHVVAPGAGFARHAHRGVVIVSWVLDGVLRHEDGLGHVELVRPGTLLVQSAGSGIVHAEVNDSVDEPVRFIQSALLAGIDDPSVTLGPPPVEYGSAGFAVLTAGPQHVAAPRIHLYVARGSFTVDGAVLAEGDSVRADEPVSVDGAGELLVWSLPDAPSLSGLRPGEQ